MAGKKSELPQGFHLLKPDGDLIAGSWGGGERMGAGIKEGLPPTPPHSEKEMEGVCQPPRGRLRGAHHELPIRQRGGLSLTGFMHTILTIEKDVSF